MKRLFIALAVIALGACSGNFSTGTGIPNTIPVPGDSTQPYGTSGLPQTGESASPLPSSSPATQMFAMSDASTGFQCPQSVDGYACVLRFNVPPPTPTPSPGGKHKPSPTPSPTPTQTPTPTPTPAEGDLAGIGNEIPGAGPTPTPTPSGPTITLKAEALPKDAPPMYHTPSNTINVVPLIMTRVTPSTDFLLDGEAIAEFTLPPDQVENRGFAVQLFEQTSHKNKTYYRPIWTFDKSTLKDGTLTFDFNPPKTTIPKGTTYVLVLFGDTKKGTPAPSAAPSASASPDSGATPGASPAPSAAPT